MRKGIYLTTPTIAFIFLFILSSFSIRAQNAEEKKYHIENLTDKEKDQIDQWVTQNEKALFYKTQGKTYIYHYSRFTLEESYIYLAETIKDESFIKRVASRDKMKCSSFGQYKASRYILEKGYLKQDLGDGLYGFPQHDFPGLEAWWGGGKNQTGDKACFISLKENSKVMRLQVMRDANFRRKEHIYYIFLKYGFDVLAFPEWGIPIMMVVNPEIIKEDSFFLDFGNHQYHGKRDFEFLDQLDVDTKDYVLWK